MNSGVFLRCPPLTGGAGPAIREGYEVQIDDRGFDPETKALGSPMHLTGAVYRLAPAIRRCSRQVGEWNVFEVEAHARRITVRLNGAVVSTLEAASRLLRGHVGLQAHHAGSAVQFRNLVVVPAGAR